MSNDKNQNQQAMNHLDGEEDGVPESLGILVKHYREKRGMSLQDVYEICGVSPSYLNRLEKHERRAPTTKILRKVSTALRIPAEVLFESVFNERVSDDKELSVEDMLICNDYSINGEPAAAEAKQYLVDLIKLALNCEWTPETKMRQACDIVDIIDRLRKVS